MKRLEDLILRLPESSYDDPIESALKPAYFKHKEASGRNRFFNNRYDDVFCKVENILYEKRSSFEQKQHCVSTLIEMMSDHDLTQLPETAQQQFLDIITDLFTEPEEVNYKMKDQIRGIIRKMPGFTVRKQTKEGRNTRHIDMIKKAKQLRYFSEKGYQPLIMANYLKEYVLMLTEDMASLNIANFDQICQALNLMTNQRDVITQELADKLCEFAVSHADQIADYCSSDENGLSADIHDMLDVLTRFARMNESRAESTDDEVGDNPEADNVDEKDSKELDKLTKRVRAAYMERLKALQVKEKPRAALVACLNAAMSFNSMSHEDSTTVNKVAQECV